MEFYSFIADLNSFLLGFHATTWIPNTFVCTAEIVTAAINVNQSIHITYDPNHVWYEKTLNWTNTLSGPIAKAFKECATDTYLGYNVATHNYEQFGNATNLVMAFLQNMLGKVFTLQKLYTDISN